MTRELRHLFIRTGVAPFALGVADAARLGDDALHWGHYYAHEPVVLAGHLPQALRHLAHTRHPLAGSMPPAQRVAGAAPRAIPLQATQGRASLGGGAL